MVSLLSKTSQTVPGLDSVIAPAGALPKDFKDKIGNKMYKIRLMEARIINYGLCDIQKLMKEISTKRGLSNVHGNGIRKLLYPFLRQECKPMINILFTFSPSITNIESTRNTFRISKLISNLKIIPMKIKQNQPKDPERESFEQMLNEKDIFIEELEIKLKELYQEHESLKLELNVMEDDMNNEDEYDRKLNETQRRDSIISN